jgi:hypothetical protein
MTSNLKFARSALVIPIATFALTACHKRPDSSSDSQAGAAYSSGPFPKLTPATLDQARTTRTPSTRTNMATQIVLKTAQVMRLDIAGRESTT